MKETQLSNRIITYIKQEEEKCVGCKRCMENCPMLGEYCVNPKLLLNKIVEDEKIDIMIPYSCALCSYCTQVCPKKVDLRKNFLEIREEIVERNHGIPKEINHKAVKFHQKNSFSKLFTASFQGSDKSTAKKMFFPGCSLMAYNPEIVMKTYNYLQSKIIDIGIVAKCCGNPTYAMGDTNLFEKYYASVQADLNHMEVEEVIVACQNCFQTIKRNSPQVRVTSLWEVIGEIGIPDEIAEETRKIPITFALHDPCPTRNEVRIHEGVRKIVEVMGLKIEELPFSREKTLCCGSGAMIGVTNHKIAEQQMKKRAEQAKSAYILTYCEECVGSMKRGGKKSIHILDLLFNKKAYEKLDQEENSTLSKWINRYHGKRKINRLKNRKRTF